MSTYICETNLDGHKRRHLQKYCQYPLISTDRSSRQKINKETAALNDTLDQKDLIDIFRAFLPKAVEYTFFSSAHGTISSPDHMLGHKTISINLED